MADSTGKALLLAVTKAVKTATDDNPVYQSGGGQRSWFPIVAQVLSYITGQPHDRKSLKGQHRKLIEGRTPAAIEAMIASVDPGVYRDAVRHVLETGIAPAGPPPVVPGVNVPASKPYVPPPSRSEDPGERVQAKKEQILQQHDRKVAEKLVEQAALTGLLVDAVLDGAKHAPPVIWRPAPEVLIKPEAAEEIPVAMLGDIHVGTLVDAEEMGGLGEYNFEILKRRLNNYQTNIVNTIDLHRRGAKIRRVLVYMLGDMVEGEVIFDGQAFRIELITVDQLFECSSYVLGWLQGILNTGLVEQIHVSCIYGNHGRTTHKKGASKAHSNWDYVLYRHMTEVMRHEPRISWFVPKSWFSIVDVMGWRIYGTHGDVIKSWMGIPFYGIQRHDMRTTTLLQSVNLDYRYWICGDKHVSATIPRVTGAQIMNGSTVGGSDFSMHQLGTASEPMQTMFGINEHHGKTWQYDYVLDKRDPEDIRKHLSLMKI